MLRIPITVVTNGEEKEYICTKIGASIGYDEISNVLRLINILTFTVHEIEYKEMQIDRMSTELYKEIGDNTYGIDINAMQDYQPHREEFAALLEYINSDMKSMRMIRMEKGDRTLLVYVRKEGQNHKQFVFEYGEDVLIW